MYEQPRGPMDDIRKNPLISGLIVLCVLSNIAAVVCFAWEVSLHPSSFNWVPLILTFGMFFVPQITARGRKSAKTEFRKNCCDIFFVLYGAITLSMCCLSVGLAGDPPWGCSITHPFDCDMGHPGIWGAFFFAIASITGHAFGWEKISKQRMEENWVKDQKDWTQTNNISTYEDYTQKQLRKFEEMVNFSLQISLFCAGNFLVLFITHLAVDDSRPWLALLYLFSLLFVGLWKAFWLVTLNAWNGAHYSTMPKSLWDSVLNITLVVWLVGANWHILGNQIQKEKDLEVPIISTLLTTLIAFVQHFHI